ncbi:HIT domain-containing protein [Aliagarivorans taiwanensis]|uniref:HIT domain-containing protein n=1 Tax=Aliagarivorans taiwanensis TaxID=561966 RepID=UPI00041D87F7|nr:HIT family protein [Aliagarivorans taiwanensis]
MSEFQLHPQLEKDCYVVGDLDICRVLLMNDSNYPWFILVPMGSELRDIHELDFCQSSQFWRESKRFAKALMDIFDGYKMNVAALGNMVEQLHIHHIVRFKDDPAWPAPVWGAVPAKPYAEEQAQAIIQQVREALSEHWVA